MTEYLFARTTDVDAAAAIAAQLAAEAARDAAQAAQTAAETAQAAAELAETNAETAETNAETAETNAETAETNAETAETNAEAARDLALAYRDGAEEWAINPEDDPVSVAAGGDDLTTFSAYHWAQKATAIVTGAIQRTEYDAHTILRAIVDDTPLALTVGEQTLVGRITGGNISALTAGQVRTLLNVQDGATDDQTAAEILAALLTVDGSGSGLDADLLDGQSAAFYATATSVSDHLADTSDAHDASAISVLDSGANYAATDVEAALAEVMDALQAHEADTTDAHDASAISYNGGTGMSATDVEAAIDELATEKLNATAIATQEQAEDGTNNTEFLTPLRATQGTLAGVRAGLNVSGGGTMTYDGSNVLWSSRMIVIGDAKGTEAAATHSGFWDINCPTSGSVDVVGTTAVTATASGIPLSGWRALYYDLDTGTAGGASSFHIIDYSLGTANFVPPPSWIFLAVNNGDSNVVKFVHGVKLASGQSTVWYAPTHTFDIVVVIDGGGATITTGVKAACDIHFDFACKILGWTLMGDQSGSIVIDIWKDTYANFPPTVADTITASDKPTISSATKAQDTAPTGWTTSVSAGDILRFNVDSVTSLTSAVLVIKATKIS